MNKTPLEHFQDIKELEVADGPEITVEDILPYKCEQVEKSLKALEIIKEKQVDVCELKICIDEYEDSLYQYNKRTIEKFRLTKEEFNLLKEMLE